MKKKKMFLVKREVIAYDIKGAISGKGVIYEIQTAEDRLSEPKTITGFKKNKNKNESQIN